MEFNDIVVKSAVRHSKSITKSSKFQYGIFDNASTNKFGLSLPVNLKFGFRF